MYLVNVVLAKRILVTKRVPVGQYRTMLRRSKAMFFVDILAKLRGLRAFRKGPKKSKKQIHYNPLY